MTGFGPLLDHGTVHKFAATLHNTSEIQEPL